MVVKLSSLGVKLGVARYRTRRACMRLKSGCIPQRKQIFMVRYPKEIYSSTNDYVCILKDNAASLWVGGVYQRITMGVGHIV